MQRFISKCDPDAKIQRVDIISYSVVYIQRTFDARSKHSYLHEYIRHIFSFQYLLYCIEFILQFDNA